VHLINKRTNIIFDGRIHARHMKIFCGDQLGLLKEVSLDTSAVVGTYTQQSRENQVQAMSFLDNAESEVRGSDVAPVSVPEIDRLYIHINSLYSESPVAGVCECRFQLILRARARVVSCHPDFSQTPARHQSLLIIFYGV
jgi:hypothetical protein